MHNQFNAIIDNTPDLEYKPNFKEVVTRSLSLLHGSKGALICTGYPNPDYPLFTPTPLGDIDFNKDPLLFVREICDYWDKASLIYNELPDDRLPVALLKAGTGVWAGMISDHMEFNTNTSWVQPWSDNLQALLDREIDYRNSRWFSIFLEAMNFLNKHAKGRYLTRVGAEHAPLEFVSMIRGSDIYLDIHDDPETLLKVLCKYTKVLSKLYADFNEPLKDKPYGFSAWGLIYLHKGIVLSDDDLGNVSFDNYKKFGLPFIKKISRTFGDCALHIHANAYHQRDNISEIPGIAAYHWRKDPGHPEAIDNLEFVCEGAKKKIVVISYITPKQVRENISRFNEGRFVLCSPCTSKTEALELIDFVKNNAAPG